MLLTGAISRGLPHAAPAVIHLEEAIVGPEECCPNLRRRASTTAARATLAYHNSLMGAVLVGAGANAHRADDPLCFARIIPTG